MSVAAALQKERKHMYSLVRTMSKKQLLLKQLPSLSLSVIIAELFYKFHSFTLECIAFLATWFVIDALLSLVTAARKPAPSFEAETKLQS